MGHREENRVKRQAESPRKKTASLLILFFKRPLSALASHPWLPITEMLFYHLPYLFFSTLSIPRSLSPLKSEKACINLGPHFSCRWGPVHSYHGCILMRSVMERRFFPAICSEVIGFPCLSYQLQTLMGSLEHWKSIVGERTAFIQQDRLLGVCVCICV